MKINWEKEKENLEKLINNDISYVEIGKKYGVSYSAIRKAAKKLGINLKPRREINPSETFGRGKNDIIEKCKVCGKEFKHPKYLGTIDFCCDECKEKYFIENDFTIVEPNVKKFVNYKNIGELGEQIAIGELGKYGIQIMLPLSDNLPFDFVAYVNNKFYKCQVKTTSSISDGVAKFKVFTTNHVYTNEEIDIFILCDLEHIFLCKFTEVNDKSKKGFILRYTKTLNNQTKNVNYACDYIISQKRINEVFS